ncbi:MAG: DUF6232 family protein [Burkholderiaceae bacterium]|nr:DUF6232 family protein [Burkholderiaceae bacterium]
MEEVEYLRDRSTVVTSTRVEIDGATFAVRNIGAVKVTAPSRPWGGILLAMVAVGMMGTADSRPLGFVFLALAAWWAWQTLKRRSLVLVNGGKETVALRSSNPAAMETLRAAIANAIAAR